EQSEIPRSAIRDPKCEKSEWWLLGATRQIRPFLGPPSFPVRRKRPRGRKAVVSVTRPTYRGKRKHDPINCGRLPEADLKACATPTGPYPTSQALLNPPSSSTPCSVRSVPAPRRTSSIPPAPAGPRR